MIVVLGSALVAAAILWRHDTDGGEQTAATNAVPAWVAGYAAGPSDSHVILVVEACEDWRLEETWTAAQESDRVELWVGWWGLSQPPCDAPALRSLEFALQEPLGDRRVFLTGGAEVEPFEGAAPPLS
ncbi:hypothetical protein LGT39_09445 [Demequina sp. TTPB684]|uniref:hypothetical protein n=1 Tax=unclassified Demequina TaxID=2620311 RepID=UPI001CF51D10|nr:MULTISPECIES: hypothetical protein [unclassified Demequina]MCB2413065.1 hypothetical protein [Demequina sp. TTPB684]UPU88127.1 hypothetical protein LGT36_012895 [Demequina sp. TMPB413]